MMSSPIPTILLCLSYAYFCKSLAPRLMKNRKPFDLRRTLVVYNLFQTVFSAWIFYEVFHADMQLNNINCQPMHTHLLPYRFYFSIYKAAGCVIIAIDVNQQTTRPRACGWQRHAGGITSQNSRNFSTRFSSFYGKNINMSQPSMSFTMESCLLVVSLHELQPNDLIACTPVFIRNFPSNFFSVDGYEICAGRSQVSYIILYPDFRLRPQNSLAALSSPC